MVNFCKPDKLLIEYSELRCICFFYIFLLLCFFIWIFHKKWIRDNIEKKHKLKNYEAIFKSENVEFFNYIYETNDPNEIVVKQEGYKNCYIGFLLKKISIFLYICTHIIIITSIYNEYCIKINNEILWNDRALEFFVFFLLSLTITYGILLIRKHIQSLFLKPSILKDSDYIIIYTLNEEYSTFYNTNYFKKCITHINYMIHSFTKKKKQFLKKCNFQKYNTSFLQFVCNSLDLIKNYIPFPTFLEKIIQNIKKYIKQSEVSYSNINTHSFHDTKKKTHNFYANSLFIDNNAESLSNSELRASNNNIETSQNILEKIKRKKKQNDDNKSTYKNLSDISEYKQNETTTKKFKLHKVQVKTNEKNVKYFFFRSMKYLYNEEKDAFINISYSIDEKVNNFNFNYILKKGGLNNNEIIHNINQYGYNNIHLEVNSFFTNLKRELLDGIYMFQLYLTYKNLFWKEMITSIIWIVISILTVIKKVLKNQKNKKEIYDNIQSNSNINVTVYRNALEQQISSNNLTIGDIIIIKSQMTIPCDCLLLTGQVLVDESLLTGESRPMKKTATYNENRQIFKNEKEQNNDTEFSLNKQNKINPNNILYAGTNIISILNSPENIYAIVINVSIYTYKGKYMQNVLFPNPLLFKYDSQLPIVFMFTIIFSLFCFYFQIRYLGLNMTSVFYSIGTLSQILPVWTPVVLNIGLNISTNRLKNENNICCIAPSRIPICGKIRVFFFDKTGTITNHNLEFSGIHFCNNILSPQKNIVSKYFEKKNLEPIDNDDINASILTFSKTNTNPLTLTDLATNEQHNNQTTLVTTNIINIDTINSKHYNEKENNKKIIDKNSMKNGENSKSVNSYYCSAYNEVGEEDISSSIFDKLNSNKNILEKNINQNNKIEITDKLSSSEKDDFKSPNFSICEKNSRSSSADLFQSYDEGEYQKHSENIPISDEKININYQSNNFDELRKNAENKEALKDSETFNDHINLPTNSNNINYFTNKPNTIKEENKKNNSSFDENNNISIINKHFIDSNSSINSVTSLLYNSKLVWANKITLENMPENYNLVVYALAGCSCIYIDDNIIYGNEIDKKLYEATDMIIHNYINGDNINVKRISLKFDSIYKSFDVIKTFEFDYYTKISTTLAFGYFDFPEKVYIVFSKGSFDKIYQKCIKTDELYFYKQKEQEYSKNGFYVIALAFKIIYDLPKNKSKNNFFNLSRNEMETDMNFLSLIMFNNHIKVDAHYVIQTLKNSCIRPIILTGDNAYNCLYVGNKIGLFNNINTYESFYSLNVNSNNNIDYANKRNNTNFSNQNPFNLTDIKFMPFENLFKYNSESKNFNSSDNYSQINKQYIQNHEKYNQETNPLNYSKKKQDKTKNFKENLNLNQVNNNNDVGKKNQHNSKYNTLNQYDSNIIDTHTSKMEEGYLLESHKNMNPVNYNTHNYEENIIIYGYILNGELIFVNIHNDNKINNSIVLYKDIYKEIILTGEAYNYIRDHIFKIQSSENEINSNLMHTNNEFKQNSKKIKQNSSIEQYKNFLLKVRIFSRLTPNNKMEIIKDFIKFDYISGMCGDGSNDCGALKTSHAGLALSNSDTSVVAPFSAKNENLKSVIDILREGRACLVTSINCYKYMLLYGFMISIIKIILFMRAHAIMSEYGYLFFDNIILLLLAKSMTLSKPEYKLKTQTPTSSIIGAQTILSLLCTLIVNFFFLYIIMFKFFFLYNLPSSYYINISAPKSSWWLMSDNYESFLTCIWFCFQIVNSAFILTLGGKYRKHIFSNYTFMMYYALINLFLFYLTIGGPNKLTCLFRMNCNDEVSKQTKFKILELFSYSAGGLSFYGPNGNNILSTEVKIKFIFLNFLNIIINILISKYILCERFYNIVRKFFKIQNRRIPT
ncbi:cation transporting P-ATPase, putative [Plasmodium berghei]|uniref:Cation transporting P-ATPase, putative n=2 Tax=Plasmodium berghei TaxID=5821 RepID=A0A509ANP0_PLABA|nr:cation transporting P-ATPase, putative [Plasmodium berghei ANKA]CXI59692.1 cation transporting P-ATPase, putative [Plasmodium berghei]SCM23487.1 cation transporting P-ATPase, putative [Plasmodium berghei]SCN26613.1 cation transporting P-ATPase, putative [Plasmodium berghei]SCO60880.1 cation transporting P-ATPase, putative [Plasmodium berghei]SCO62889.1 cation transporting P-ATPase, putative [Plasmodium berghei]|eukprot:XP_034422245.1 cation transporting P-ATPase, putative [Plasmodium berghei ANKA]